MTEYLEVAEKRIGLELDEFLCLAYPMANKGFIRRQIRAGRVLLDGGPARPSDRLRISSVVCVEFEKEDLPIAPHAPSQAIPILHEDAQVLVVDKPSSRRGDGPGNEYHDKGLYSASRGLALPAECVESSGNEKCGCKPLFEVRQYSSP